MGLLNQAFFALLRNEICNEPISEDLVASVTPDLISKLYLVSNHHDLAHLVGASLEKLSLLPPDNEISTKFQRKQMMAVFRSERFRYELNVLCRAFEKEQIPFIPLKGSVLRGYYPEPWMRTSCDIDILVREKDLDRALKIVTGKLEYVTDFKGPHDVALISPSGVHVELHYDLIEGKENPKAKSILKTVWDHAPLAEDSQYRHELSDEMFFFYHIAHMAKHFVHGGCGVRSFLDLWILEQLVEHTDAKRNELLERGGLLMFADSCRKLSRSWFSGASADELTLKMGKYILTGGVYGSFENKLVAQQYKTGGKFGYAMKRIFHPYNDLCVQYPILFKHKWLLPFCEVHRWFKLVFGGKLKSSVNELNVNRKRSKDSLKETSDFMSSIGL